MFYEEYLKKIERKTRHEVYQAVFTLKNKLKCIHFLRRWHWSYDKDRRKETEHIIMPKD